MDWLVILLRLTHIGLGIMWVGMMLFNVLFLMPALREAGPQATPVMAALQRRRLMLVMPLVALGTILSGFWMVERMWGGMANLLATRVGSVFAFGAAAALLAFLLGIAIMRPAMIRAEKLSAGLEALGDGERATQTALIQRLRARGAAMSWIVTVLVVLATAAMAVARYV